MVARNGRCYLPADPPEWLGPRHRRILAWTAVGAGLTGLFAGLSVACLALDARPWSAAFALATLATVPLLAIAPLRDRYRHRRRMPS